MTNIEAILTNYDRIFKGTTMWKEQRSFLKQSLTSFEKEIREAEQIRIEIELDGAYPKDGNIPKRDIATALEEQREKIYKEVLEIEVQDYVDNSTYRQGAIIYRDDVLSTLEKAREL